MGANSNITESLVAYPIRFFGIKGLFRGSIATLWRETLPGGVYLTLYDYLCKKMEAKK